MKESDCVRTYGSGSRECVSRTCRTEKKYFLSQSSKYQRMRCASVTDGCRRG